jgi:hypothetical protein
MIELQLQHRHCGDHIPPTDAHNTTALLKRVLVVAMIFPIAGTMMTAMMVYAAVVYARPRQAAETATRSQPAVLISFKTEARGITKETGRNEISMRSDVKLRGCWLDVKMTAAVWTAGMCLLTGSGGGKMNGGLAQSRAALISNASIQRHGCQNRRRASACHYCGKNKTRKSNVAAGREAVRSVCP